MLLPVLKVFYTVTFYTVHLVTVIFYEQNRQHNYFLQTGSR